MQKTLYCLTMDEAYRKSEKHALELRSIRANHGPDTEVAYDSTIFNNQVELSTHIKKEAPPEATICVTTNTFSHVNLALLLTLLRTLKRDCELLQNDANGWLLGYYRIKPEGSIIELTLAKPEAASA